MTAAASSSAATAPRFRGRRSRAANQSRTPASRCAHPLLIAVPSAACFVLGLLDWRRPWRVEHLDLLALAGFFPVAMLLSDDVSQAGPVAGSRRPQVWLSAYDTKLETVLAGRGLFPVAEPHPARADTAVTSNALPVSATYLMSSLVVSLE